MKKKFVLFGCQKIAADCIEHIVQNENAELLHVYTYDLPLDITYGYKSVQEKCNQLNIPCKKPKNITKDLMKEIASYEPDYILSIYYRKIFPKSLLQLPKYGCINIHPSLLPEYRGPVPTAWALLNGEKETGITIHLMDEGIDTGDILFQKTVDIDYNDTGFDLYTKIMNAGVELFIENFEQLIENNYNKTKQSGLGSYYGKLDSKHYIDWQSKCEDIRNIVKVHAPPFNPVETQLYNHYFFINKVSSVNDSKYTLQGPGKIVDIINDKPVVSCVDGFLKLDEYDIYPKLTKEEKLVYFRIGNQFD